MEKDENKIPNCGEVLEKKEELKVKNFEIVQQMKYMTKSLSEVENILEERGTIKDWHYIVHNKDVDEIGNHKEDHIHIFGRMGTMYGVSVVGGWFGVAPERVGRIKGKYDDAILYAVHANAPEKYQYESNEVVSSFNYVEKLERVKEKKNIEKESFRRKIDGDKKALERKKEIVELIKNGVIKEYNFYEYVDEFENEKYDKIIKIAFNHRLLKLQRGGADRTMEVIYITGDSGSGKTTLAKYMAESKKLSYYISSSSNDILGDYKGEDVIVLDDLRTESLKMADLLKMLDNNTKSTVKSRYRNKFLECKMIIITSVWTINQFHAEYYNNIKEPIKQLKRRIGTCVTVKKDKMYFKMYNELIDDYGDVFETENPVYKIIKKKSLTEEEQKNKALDLFGLSDNVVMINKSKNKLVDSVEQLNMTLEEMDLFD